MIESIADFQFEDDSHSYVTAGRNHPSVTGLLKKYGLISYYMVKPDLLERKRVQGKELHLWTAGFDMSGVADMLSIAEDAMGYAESYMLFRRESGFEILEIEKPLMSSIYGVIVGGTPDRCMRYKRTHEVTLDLKFCAKKMPAWRVQVSGYEMLKYKTTKLGGMGRERASLMLFPDGKYHLEFYADPADGDAFKAIASLEAFKQNHGIKGD